MNENGYITKIEPGNQGEFSLWKDSKKLHSPTGHFFRFIEIKHLL